MERGDDVQLIHSILSGDDTAFDALVEKYKKSVHGLVWRKIGDFHYAEEITQDTFIQVYKKLSTLKDPNHFAGWLYVIANRLCIDWMRKRKLTIQSLENTSLEDIEKVSYARYLLDRHETESAERRHKIVKKLLAKLPESERTVVTLYYLGEMTMKEISKFLGVSVKTISSRLSRARKRLRQEEDLFVQEFLGGVKFSANLKQNIMRRVANMNPTSPSTAKPIIPWIAFGTAAVFIILLLGASNQYLARFQKPYSFEAQSEPTIEIIDTSVVLDIDSKPDTRDQTGRALSSGKSNTVSSQILETPTISAVGKDFPAKLSTSQWTSLRGPQSSRVSDIFITSGGTLYARSSIGVYRSTADESTWTLVNIDVPTGNYPMFMTEYADTLYAVSGNKVSRSTDDGEKWVTLGLLPDGIPTGLVVIGTTEEYTPQRVVIYLALRNRGVFRSTDPSRQWTSLNNGLTDKKIHRLAAIGNTVFAGTNAGLYRLNANVWEQLSMEPSKTVHALTVFEDNLYVGTGRSVEMIMIVDDSRAGKIFRSSDLGTSWTEITPKSDRGLFKALPGISIAVTGETISVHGTESFRSRDNGQTWTDLEVDIDSVSFVALNEDTFYKAGIYGIQRTTDGGASWHPYMNGMIGTGIRDLVAFNNKLYASTLTGLVQSVDGGESWTSVPTILSELISESSKSQSPNNDRYPHLKLAVADNVLYAIGDLGIFRSSINRDDTDVFVPVQGAPAFDEITLGEIVLPPAMLEETKKVAETHGIYSSDNREKDNRLLENLLKYHGRPGAFAVGNGTFYIEYKWQLFKWKPGYSKWENTRLIESSQLSGDSWKNRLKLAVTEETIYVGNYDGRLFQSLDAGNSWRDVTPNFPFKFTRFNEIVLVGSTIYVSTDKGILVSQTGEHWRALTDGNGARIVMDSVTEDGITVYGAGDAGVYRLGDGERWQQISPNVPDKVLSLVVGKDRLYIATRHSGMFHISLEKEHYDELSHK